MTVRPETPADHDEIRALVTSAVGPADGRVVYPLAFAVVG